MEPYAKLSKEELVKLEEELTAKYLKMQAKGLKLNMARGKPCPEQLDFSMGIMDALDSKSDMKCSDGTDVRNYGLLTGIPEAKKLMGDMMEVPAENVIVYGNSSLNIMFDQVSRSYTHGVMGNKPWCRLKDVKFICVVPGYDRHFAVTEHFGIESVCVPMTKDGPDMDLVEKLVSADESIKGIWCVPKYSNPTGNTYSDETVRRMAALKPAAKDFRIYWDNAYILHHLNDRKPDRLLEILSACREAGNPDLVFEFSSTSKISFAGAGLAAIAASKDNLEDIKKHLKFQTIGYDKVNQLRHVRYFKNLSGLKKQMKQMATMLRPKFKAVDDILTKELDGLGIATWTKPNGGYFISFDTMNGCAAEVIKCCAEAGVVLTPAGSTYPCHFDPNDANIRIAPSYPSTAEIKTAAELLALCTKLVSVRKLLSDSEKKPAAKKTAAGKQAAGRKKK